MNKLLSFGMDFSSFLLERIDRAQIKRIVLFGSVSRDEADETSDVDLFIDVVEENKGLEKKIQKNVEEFYSSTRYRNYWELKGVDNTIKAIVGELDKWKQLKNSIISTGITVYEKFKLMPNNITHKAIFSWENITPESKRVLLSKRLFGYKKDKNEYAGLIKKYKGERLSKGSIIVSNEHSAVFAKLFKSMKITVKIRKIVEYS